MARTLVNLNFTGESLVVRDDQVFLLDSGRHPEESENFVFADGTTPNSAVVILDAQIGFASKDLKKVSFEISFEIPYASEMSTTRTGVIKYTNFGSTSGPGPGSFGGSLGGVLENMMTLDPGRSREGLRLSGRDSKTFNDDLLEAYSLFSDLEDDNYEDFFPGSASTLGEDLLKRAMTLTIPRKPEVTSSFDNQLNRIMKTVRIESSDLVSFEGTTVIEDDFDNLSTTVATPTTTETTTDDSFEGAGGGTISSTVGTAISTGRSARVVSGGGAY